MGYGQEVFLGKKKKKNFQQSVIQVVLIGLGLFHDHWALTSQYQVSFRLDQVSKD